MKYNAFEKSIDKFISKNEDLISTYENTCNDIFEDNLNDIYQLYESLIKINKYKDLNTVLKEALQNSISRGSSVLDSICDISAAETYNTQELNTTQRYFKEVNDIYVKNNNNYDIEYCPENREKLIEMNLKSVIAVAKKYQGLGLTLDELISAGNLGLCIAYDRYDPSKAKLKDNMLDAIKDLGDKISYQELNEVLGSYLTYGGISERFNSSFNESKEYKKSDIELWIHRNVSNAKFNSIANMWIRAYILIEIDNCSRVVRKPKTEIYKEAIETGSYKKEQTVDIDAPISDDSQNTIGDLLQTDNEEFSELEISEAYDIYKAGLNKLLDGVKNRDRSVFLKKFGIGLPRPMLPREIAEQEGLSIARVSQILQIVTEQIQKNAVKFNVDIDMLFDAARKLN